MSENSRIHVLSELVANKIAAGEVVDRPASVLKELIENALDAGAKQIDVEVVAGGRKSIAVSDDGEGMSRDDALLSVERHATSKIRDVEDIEQVSTLGFRGEALAAIAAVSRFSLVTRTRASAEATEILMSGGKIQEVRETGRAPGTTVRVRHLFFNVPARRKFMRSEQTELTHIRHTFLVYALAHPEVGMTLSVDGRPFYRLNHGDAQLDRLRGLFGAESVKALRPVDYKLQNVSIKGHVSLPYLTRNDRAEQFVFVNRRPASAAMLSYALEEGYHGLVQKGRYPMVCLFIDLDPTLVDVNVHPMKKEVRFRQPIAIRDAVIEAVREALAQDAPADAAGATTADAPSETASPPEEPLIRIDDLPAMRTFAYPRIPMASTQPPAPSEEASSPAEEGAPVSVADAAPWARCRILGQVGGLYVVLETDEGLVLMDPHAAHERVLYERYMKQVLAQDVKGQGLLTSETVELSPRDAQTVRQNQELLRAMGFGISEFGGEAFIVDAVPACLGNASASSIVGEVARSLEKAGARGGTERWAEEAVAQASCKSAVKARDALSVQEVEQLVIDLARAEMPYTCPHGRPTVVFMSYQELHKKFGRL